MPRAFDLSRQPKRKPAPSVSHAPSAPRRRKKGRGMFTFVMFVAVIGAFAYLLSSFAPTSSNMANSRPNPTTTPTTPPSNTNPNVNLNDNLNTNSSNSNSNLNSNENSNTNTNSNSQNNTNTNSTASGPKIQILNGSGILDVSDKVKGLLEENNLPVADAGIAQFEYSQTYIYYRKDFSTEAQKIKTILGDYKPSTSPSQVDGLFDILVIVGKSSLPQTQ